MTVEDLVCVRRARDLMDRAYERTGDVRGMFDRVTAAGAEVIQEPTEMGYGVLDCAVRDSSGNHIRIGQAMAAADER